MISYLKWVFLLALWSVILFFAKELGINVILFMIPLMGYMYHVLKKNNKIKNKCGLLFMIPIILVSLSYLLFDVMLFKVLNIVAIPILIALMVLYTTDSTYNVFKIAGRVIEYLFVPFDYVSRLYRVTKNQISQRLKVSDKTTKVLKALLIVVPITIIILALLSSADMIFGEIFGDLLDELLDILKLEFFDHLLGRIVIFIIIFFAIGCTTMYIMYEKKKDEVVKEQTKERDLLTAKILVTVLNVIYIVFDYIQIKSLLLHSVSSSIDYASYARRGFFELLVVSLINLTIILITRRLETKKNTKEFNYIKIMDVIMIFLTIVIIASSFLRMHMYEVEYGYTTLRLLVFAILITEAILMIPTVMYIFNKEVNIVKSYMIILIIAYLCVNYMNMDYVIAKKNVNRYNYVEDLDLYYLENDQYGNIPILVDLYLNKNIKDTNLKNELGEYLNNKSIDARDWEHSIFEFNIPYYKAKKAFKKVDLSEYEYKYRDYLDY